MKENTRFIFNFVTCDFVRYILTRKYYTTPIPMNMLAKLQGKNKSPDIERDWRNDPVAMAFNNSLSLQAENKIKFNAFLLVFFRKLATEHFMEEGHPDFSLKAMALNHGVEISTVSRWGYDVAWSAYRGAKKMLNANEAVSV